MFHSVTLYEMLSVTSSRSLCFTALLCMKYCQCLPADHYVGSHWQHFIQSNTVKHKDLLEVTDNISYRVTLWNIAICWKSVTTFHSVTSSRSLCFTALLCVKCCQWLPADSYVSQCYHNDLLEVTDNISYRVALWNIKICWKSLTTLHTETSSRSLCFTALLCMKYCQCLPADHYVSQR
jgi:hypothetical protein